MPRSAFEQRSMSLGRCLSHKFNLRSLLPIERGLEPCLVSYFFFGWLYWPQVRYIYITNSPYWQDPRHSRICLFGLSLRVACCFPFPPVEDDLGLWNKLRCRFLGWVINSEFDPVPVEEMSCGQWTQWQYPHLENRQQTAAGHLAQHLRYHHKSPWHYNCHRGWCRKIFECT